MTRKGNQNALKHGFYAKRYSPTETSDLDKTRQDLLDEINVLRVFARRITDRLSDKSAGEYSEDDVRCLNILVNITISIGTLMRSQAMISGRSSNIEKSIEDAVLSIKERWTLA